jgi:hypothetical protein
MAKTTIRIRVIVFFNGGDWLLTLRKCLIKKYNDNGTEGHFPLNQL